MRWTIHPSSLAGSIAIPPSKSHTIRAILVASLARGRSVIRRPLMHGDGKSAIGVATALGAFVEEREGTLVVEGTGADRDRGADSVFTGNSGTSTNLFTSVAALGSRRRRFDGDSSIRSRPVRPLLEALSRLGAVYEIDPSAGRDVPFFIRGPLAGGETTVSGVSSQFVSSLLLSCPLAPGATSFTVTNLQERPYVELTMWWLRRSGIRFSASPVLDRFEIPGSQKYAAINLTVPSDFSSATFAAVAAAITGSTVMLTGLDFSDPQGDKRVFDILESMGATVSRGADSVTVSGGRLVGQEIDLNTTPDALPAFAVAGCFASGTTKLVNVAHARIKETDRVAVMARELGRMGARVEERADGLVVHESALRGTTVDGHDDHRVVMALACAAMAASGVTTITTAESAQVTYPSFADDFRAIGARIETAEG